MKRKEGKAIAALHHADVGDIDIWYGNDKAGLKKIAKKHPEVLNDLQGIIDKMGVKSASDNRIVLESDTHKAVISKKIGDEKTDNWLLSAYEQKGVSGGSSDIVPEPVGKQNGTAPLQNAPSADKVTEFLEENANFMTNGNKSEQNQTDNRRNGRRVSQYRASAVQISNDRSAIRLLEPEYPAGRAVYSEGSEGNYQRREDREKESARLIAAAKANGLYMGTIYLITPIIPYNIEVQREKRWTF